MGQPTPNFKTKKRIKAKGAELINRQAWAAPDAADADGILDGVTIPAAGVTKVAADLAAQPDFARQIVIQPKTNTGDVKAGDVTITGTDIDGNVITDAITFIDNDTNARNSAKAFKTITSIAWPAQDGSTATWDVGTTDALGLEEKLDGDTVLFANHTGTRETTHPTLVSNSSDKTKNLITLNTALDGSGDVEVTYIYPYPPV